MGVRWRLTGLLTRVAQPRGEGVIDVLFDALRCAVERQEVRFQAEFGKGVDQRFC